MTENATNAPRASAPAGTGVFAWYRTVSGVERRTFWVCYIGHILDAMDTQFYSFVIPTLIAQWGLTHGQAGQIGSAALITSAAGGWLAGILADRIGRVRVLQITIFWFAVCSLFSGLAQNYWQLLVARSLLGFGFGGETAVSAILIAEVISAYARGRAVGLVQSGWSIGSAAAAILSAALLSAAPDPIGWRLLFAVGVLPAILILFVRRATKEPEIYLQAVRANPLGIFGRPMLRTTLLAALVSSGALGGNFAMNIWLPTFLKTVRGLSVVGTSGFLVVLNGGSLCGYLMGSYLADRIGRKLNFVCFALGAMITLTIYTRIEITNTEMLLLGFPLGFFSSGILAGIGSFFSELFPTHLRGSGQGFAFNAGRAIGALFPAIVGLVGNRIPLGTAIGTVGLVPYIILLTALFFLPETRGRRLDLPAPTR